MPKVFPVRHFILTALCINIKLLANQAVKKVQVIALTF